MTRQFASIVPVWIFAVVAAVIVGVSTTGADAFTWLPIMLAASVILTFALQLALRQKEGFVLRVMASVTGAVIVLGVATAISGSIA